MGKIISLSAPDPNRQENPEQMAKYRRMCELAEQLTASTAFVDGWTTRDGTGSVAGDATITVRMGRQTMFFKADAIVAWRELCALADFYGFESRDDGVSADFGVCKVWKDESK